MTAKELYDEMKKMNNIERNDFLDILYTEYFDKGVPIERLIEEGRILEAYYSGDLIEAS
ncbi:MAG: hypothetical protein FWF78_03670 [Defluviitaleaceae bacterium]|nr:hypothetical protein [Defluviitaleaceae bacterium]